MQNAYKLQNISSRIKEHFSHGFCSFSGLYMRSLALFAKKKNKTAEEQNLGEIHSTQLKLKGKMGGGSSPLQQHVA